MNTTIFKQINFNSEMMNAEQVSSYINFGIETKT